jgi:glycosyltransferase involved in cell wall biosynthesis
VLAPHLLYPTRNGADILIDRRWCEFSHHVLYVDIVAHDRVIRYERGVQKHVKTFHNTLRTKMLASVRSVLFFSHYLAEKFITDCYRRIAEQYLLDMNYEIVVCSFISTASLVDKNKKETVLYCIETLNDEIKWFQDMRHSSQNLIIKLVAWISERWLVHFIRKNESHFLYIHVSEADRAGYTFYAPKHLSYVAPVGCDPEDIKIEHAVVQIGRPVRLLFVGSLSVKMNYDAIVFFAIKFQPVLHQGFPDGLEVRIVGSNPTAQVDILCSSKGWDLRANVTEDEIVACYGWADFSLLPFPYATGGKLKLLKSLSLGVPFLATTAVAGQLDEVCDPSLISDAPGDWVDRIRKVQMEGITQQQRNKLMKVAEKNSWRNIADNLYSHFCSIS